MLPYEINGLPLHILLVHVVVIVVPLGAIMTFLGAVWPAFRRKLTFITPLVTFVGLASVPLATNAGEWLLARVNPTPLITAHAAIGDTLVPWAFGQFVLATAIWVWYRSFAAPYRQPEPPTRNLGTPDERDPFVVAEATPADASPRGARPAGRFAGRVSRRASLVVSVVFMVLALALGTATTIRVVQIGESGAAAIWTGSFSDTPK
ncbi:hypothetical protein [Subtercola frigoramans]|uniref:Cytochrome c oxidase assembly protein n=1 Tax=Subtercola frigoramans TaxID=120298 RepID=A0ABS2L1Y4_9MICO|nr:hypothetical protein [Subtercola frigoramans]MBM7471077.1 hypothetical protein [Subtercola frigoramans]